MTAVMKGMRIVEVAEHALAPGAGALLSDWGAEVVKIEPVERGDAFRGLAAVGPSGVHTLFHTANRGKRSVALDLADPDGREILYKLVEAADVFITNKLPSARQKLLIDVEHIRARNPNIVYARASGQGVHGPEADRGAYDFLTYWHRAGISTAARSPRDELPFLAAPGFGDFTGAMFLAGGIMGALLHRERTGEAPVVDVSLLAAGMWAMNTAIAGAATDGVYNWPPQVKNPLSAIYRTRDGRHVALCCLQAGHYWKPLCEVLGRPDLGADPRFADHASIMANWQAAEQALSAVFAQKTLEQWTAILAGFSGQWAVVQDALQVASDPQALANGYIQTVETADGKPYRIVAAPIQFDGAPARPRPGPDFGAHGDEVLAELGFDEAAVIDLKVRGVVG